MTSMPTVMDLVPPVAVLDDVLGRDTLERTDCLDVGAGDGVLAGRIGKSEAPRPEHPRLHRPVEAVRGLAFQHHHLGASRRGWAQMDDDGQS